MAPKHATWTLCLLLISLAPACAGGPGRVTLANRSAPLGAAAFPVSEGTEQVRLLTLNLQLLPPPVGHTVSDRRRLRDLVDRILAEEPGYDVLCFEEVFNETLRAELGELLARRFPHQVLRCRERFGIRQDSGLCLFSRFPIRRRDGRPVCAFHTFPLSFTLTADMLAAKGILGVALDLGDGRDLWVFVTHLQADPDVPGAFARVRAQQLRRVGQFVRERLAEREPGRACGAVLVGDLNVVGDMRPGSECSRMRELLGGPRDVHVEADRADATWVPGENSLIPPTDAAAQRLDYVLVYDAMARAGGAPVRLLRLGIEDCGRRRYRNEEGDLSDHYGLFVVARLASAGTVEVATAGS